MLPEIEALKRLCQSLAMLDAIVEPEWEGRYYSFDARWSKGEMMASMRNGEGDSWVALFTHAGAILKGFAHESPMSPYFSNPPRVCPGVLDEVPEVFSSFLREPSFAMGDTTFCLWRTEEDATWQRGDIQFPKLSDPDGSKYLLAILDGDPQMYQRWAQEYFERELPISAVSHIYEHRALSQKIIRALNADLSLADVAEDAAEIGY